MIVYYNLRVYEEIPDDEFKEKLMNKGAEFVKRMNGFGILDFKVTPEQQQVVQYTPEQLQYLQQQQQVAQQQAQQEAQVQPEEQGEELPSMEQMEESE